MTSTIPLCIDLDGTLIHSDMLFESTINLIKSRPSYFFHLPIWLYKGKAFLKRSIAERTKFDPSLLPYNHGFLIWLRQQRLLDRQLVLCTASDELIAKSIAQYLGLFDAVIASDGVINLAGNQKAQVLVKRYGENGFDYAGNSKADIKVWAHCRRAVVVNASDSVHKAAQAHCEVENVFSGVQFKLSACIKALRVHQWLKNALLFVPLIAAHRVLDGGAWLPLLIAFLAFSLCASSVYIANDLLDLDSDRQHPRKCKRPFAAGTLSIITGALIAPFLLVASFLLASQVNTEFLAWLMLYFVVTCLYSFKLKQLVLIDCLCLAGLYTLRIVAGAAAVQMQLSFWLLAFSVFLFLSLAFVKRHAELLVQASLGNQKAHGRGYIITDAPLIQAFGIVSGFSSVLVLALYLNSTDVLRLYQSPQWVWGTVPVMLFWVSWVWFRAHRGEMHDDPLLFAVKDKVSIVAGAIFTLFLLVGTMGWKW